MHKLIFLIAFLPIISCTEKHNKSPKSIEVNTHTTIETFMILRSIAHNDPLFQYRDAHYKGKPMMYEARQYFKNFTDHPAVVGTQNLLKSTSNTGDVILQGLLYFEELPSTKQRYQIDAEHWQANSEELINYIELVHDFYQEAKVAHFIEIHSAFYENAKKEAKSYLDNQLISNLEEYFGTENHAYQMILIPNSPFGMGFGASVQSSQGSTFYQILSPANDVEWNENSTYTTYGFAGEGANEYYRDMVVHEFCHPFVTPLIDSDSMRSEIAKTDSLFVPLLDSIMSQQGYSTWWGFVNEHLVRLGELRVAKTMNSKVYEAMRKYNIEESGFILLPEAEELVIEYENNRNQYPTFQEFIPVLINQLATYNQQQINHKIETRLSKNIQ